MLRPPPPPKLLLRLAVPRLLESRALEPLFTPLNALLRDAEAGAARLADGLAAGREMFGDGAAEDALGRLTFGDAAGRLTEGVPVLGLGAAAPVEGRAATLPVEGAGRAAAVGCVEGRAVAEPQPRLSMVPADAPAAPLVRRRFWSGCHFCWAGCWLGRAPVEPVWLPRLMLVTVTTCCGVVRSVPAFWAFPRRDWMASINSFCWSTKV